MTLFRHRTLMVAGLRARCGAFCITRGIFNVTLMVDPDLEQERPETIRFALLHEECHRVQHHGLVAALLFPARPIVLPWLERVADRYAANRIGKKAAEDAMRRIMPFARSATEGRLYGYTWRDRLERAGI